MIRPGPGASLLLAAAALALLPACRSNVSPDAPAAPPARTPLEAPPRTPPPPIAEDPGDVALAEIDRLVKQWDDAQAEGRVADASRLHAQLAQRATAEHDALASAARGARGQAGGYVGTMALSFSRRPEATAVLVERLDSRDPRLVANALIALKLRADPATPLEPLLAHLGSGNADVRRYAPLAFAHVLEARRAAGVPPDAALEARALAPLAAGARDRDDALRLHAARALGALSVPGAEPPLLSLLEDSSRRVGLGAARALAARGAPEGFAGVVELLHHVDPQAKPLVAAVLVIYAERLQGRPLTQAEQQQLGTSPIAWSRWHGAWLRAQPAAPPAPAGR
jgi:HEAT repeat protein